MEIWGILSVSLKDGKGISDRAVIVVKSCKKLKISGPTNREYSIDFPHDWTMGVLPGIYKVTVDDVEYTVRAHPNDVTYVPDDGWENAFLD